MQSFPDTRRGNLSFSCHAREDLLTLYIICAKNFHKVIGGEKKVLYITGKSSLLIIPLESEVIDVPGLNIHQPVAPWVCLSACHTQRLGAFCLFQNLGVPGELREAPLCLGQMMGLAEGKEESGKRTVRE